MTDSQKTLPAAGSRKKPGILTRLARNKSGLALTEFAYALPIFTGLGMFGLETANLTLTSLRVSQAALNLSDNASRMGQAIANSTSRTVYESDVNQMLTGLGLQAGDIEILERGRVILSSLERNGDGGQWIHWQRCKGKANYQSDYGTEDTGATGTSFAGMGEAGNEVTASDGTAVMFVEIIYEHEPLFGDLFYQNKIIRHEAVFNIRDNRNLGAGVVADGEPAATCNLYTST
ncbi:hypothetical protein SAMN02745824_2542 [Parasphingorhabdus marina DSM 22363]|uniref:TadE-like protein n=1 Tax=Parasphingorhabdus marina DSM 22363 TaxID=1123272 RepID=A0A1N6FTK8_9SPHN|nr:hypothetical protein [Parasphingorhabdus marina]SIN98666.1 hypothetical protein SAMN02745824_2542 [Parasphingorhabdus marina DSM 22363]